MQSTCRKVRVLHVTGTMNPGGIESWLLQLLAAIDRQQYQFDFLVYEKGPFHYSDDIRAGGARELYCPGHQNPLSFGLRFLRILARSGPFDVVHSHVHHYSAVIMFLAAIAGVPVRIAHSHNDFDLHVRLCSPTRRAYHWAARHAIRLFAHGTLSCSTNAGTSLFGADWRPGATRRIIRCGIDFTRFLATVDRSAVRRELGLADDALVIGHVGRFDPQKNHLWLLSMFAHVVERAPLARLLLVGTGPCEAEVRREALRSGLGQHVVFSGPRNDVPALMLAAIDVFTLPSLFEGLPLVLLEAQAAGLPCVVSDTITTEAEVMPGRLVWLSLSSPQSLWADSIVDAGRRGRIPARRCVDVMSKSEFAIASSADATCSFYEDLLRR